MGGMFKPGIKLERGGRRRPGSRRLTIHELFKKKRPKLLGFPKHPGFRIINPKERQRVWKKFGEEIFGEYWNWKPDKKTLQKLRNLLGYTSPHNLDKMSKSAFNTKKREGNKSGYDKREIYDSITKRKKGKKHDYSLDENNAHDDFEMMLKAQKLPEKIQKTFETKNPALAVGTAWLVKEIDHLPENAKSKMKKIIRNHAMGNLGALDELRYVEIMAKSRGADWVWTRNKRKELRDEILTLRKRGIKASIDDAMREFKRNKQTDELKAMRKLLGENKLDDGVVNIMHNSCIEYANKIYSPEFMEFLRDKHGYPNTSLKILLFYVDIFTLGIRHARASKPVQKRVHGFLKNRPVLTKILEEIFSANINENK